MAVYFIQAGENGPVKIGYSVAVKFRFRAMQTNNHEPLRLLAVIDGDEHIERDIQRRFSSSRVRGEWYAPTPDLMAHITSLPNPPPSHGKEGRG